MKKIKLDVLHQAKGNQLVKVMRQDNLSGNPNVDPRANVMRASFSFGTTDTCGCGYPACSAILLTRITMPLHVSQCDRPQDWLLQTHCARYCMVKALRRHWV